MPNYTTYVTANFLDDASFIRWGKGEAAAAVFWEAWLATAPANATTAQAAQLLLRLLLAAEPVPVSSYTLQFIWHDISQSIAEQQVRRRTWQWAAVAATALASVGLSCWLLTRPAPSVPLARPHGPARYLTLAEPITLVVTPSNPTSRRPQQVG